MATGWTLRAEGVNFAATVYDTQDLSTIRGAGLALLALADPVRAGLAAADVAAIEEIQAGASSCVFTFDAADEAAAEAAAAGVRRRLAIGQPGEPPFALLSFVVDIAPGKDDRATQIGVARNHARQLREFTVDLPDPSHAATRPDKLGGMRAATTTIALPGEAEPQPASFSVKARRDFGRQQRQKFYGDNGCRVPDGLVFTDTVLDIVGAPPEVLAPALTSKLAYVYADGNGFGAIRTSVGIRDFSAPLKILQQTLLQTVVAWFADAACRDDPRFAMIGAGRRALRLETLLWGGDEFVFVMPAWLATGFLEGFFSHTRDWQIGGERLTHAVGVVICDQKTPIRQVRATLGQLADTVKQARPGAAAANGVAIEVFESVDLPDDSLAAARARLYGTEAGDEELDRQLLLPGDTFGDVLRRMAAIRDERTGLPRSQIHAVLRKIRAPGQGPLAPIAKECAREHLIEYFRRVRDDADKKIGEFRLPVFPGVGARSLPLELALVATLWDYARPFGDDLPAFAGEARP